MLNLSGDGGHMCNGKWKDIHSLLCSSCRGGGQQTFGVPTILSSCSRCMSDWITNGKCNKCGTVMEWLKTDRPWYRGKGAN